MATATTAKRPDLEALRRLTAEAIERASQEIPARAPAPAPQPETVPSVYASEPDAAKPAFGAWLLKQDKNRHEWIAMLAGTAKRDPGFPKVGTPEDVRRYLCQRGADGDMFEALDDAELDWLCL